MGEGTTTEGANAVLELPDGAVVTGVTNVNNRIEDILGIGCGQFKQIAMIAQGEFLKLLHVDSKERGGEIFRRVFDTHLFLTAQNLMKERANEAGTRLQAGGEASILHSLGSLRLPEEEEALRSRLEQADIHAVPELLPKIKEFAAADAERQGALAGQAQRLAAKMAAQITKITEARHLNQAFADLAAAQRAQLELESQGGQHTKNGRAK